MNAMRALSVKSAANGNPIQCTLVDDRSLSTHLLYTSLLKGSNLITLTNLLTLMQLTLTLLTEFNFKSHFQGDNILYFKAFTDITYLMSIHWY